MLLWSSSLEIECVSAQNGFLAVLCSNLTGNIWNGQLHLGPYRETAFVPTNTLHFNTGLKHGRWCGGKFFMGTDEGYLLSYDKRLALQHTCYAHHDRVVCLSKKEANPMLSCDIYE